ncbi:hypothetical protein Poly59_46750 [Rubripirellula reticaptiva]|uniref:Uncharacterized protein n=1 Tax=Rubripirellula reticaptiva TaxID=2528013 RepID=A0A5C6EDN2_9BACT|nr:hypothetical protein Poly59_46750 [Rubripirellula reticaptiva]
MAKQATMKPNAIITAIATAAPLPAAFAIAASTAPSVINPNIHRNETRGSIRLCWTGSNEGVFTGGLGVKEKN